MSSEINFRERFEQYDKALHYCEYCGQIFPSVGVFFAHRKASDVAGVGRLTDTGFDGHTVVQPGESVGEAVVGDAVDTFGEPVDRRVRPTELPDCDVLVLDCEGSEVEILQDLGPDPREIVVESHAELVAESRPARLRERLADMGFETEFVGWEVEAEGVGVVRGVRA